MKTSLSPYYHTLSAALLAVEVFATENQIVLVSPETFNERFDGGVPYGQTIQGHAEIATLKGKTTKKWAHLTIYRMESGTYEVIFYVL